MPGTTHDRLGRDLSDRVPTEIVEVGTWDPARVIQEAERCADVIASQADALWSDDVDTSAAVSDALVTGLAILAHRRGGVRFAGMHWDADLPTYAAATLPDTWTLPSTTRSREHRGAVFTPRQLADDIAANALGVLVDHDQPSPAHDIASLRVADIACGSGAFLLAAARYLAAELVTAWDNDSDARATTMTRYSVDDPAVAARALVINNCIHGVDVDALSVQLASIALQLLAPTCQPPGQRLAGLQVGDALVGSGHPDEAAPLAFPAGTLPLHWARAFPRVFANPGDRTCGFDAIIGNPPFLGGTKIRGAYGDAYRQHLIANVSGGRRGLVDLAVYFWLRAHELVTDYGIVAMVGPPTLIHGLNRKVGHDQLVKDEWNVYREITKLKWPTSGAAIACCVVWTHRLAHPDDCYRNVPDTCQLGEHVATVQINGAPAALFRREVTDRRRRPTGSSRLRRPGATTPGPAGRPARTTTPSAAETTTA